jgi:hypothetical protein
VSDHNTLRHDLALQTAVGRAEELASAPTLSRLETSATMAHAAGLHGVLLDQFIASHKTAPDELVLDIDATHMPLYGQQEGAHFHAHYDNYCYLPLYVFCGQDVLACVLRPSWRDPASVFSALIKLIARKLRRAWPQVRLVVRADSGFCRPGRFAASMPGASTTSSGYRRTPRSNGSRRCPAWHWPSSTRPAAPSSA